MCRVQTGAVHSSTTFPRRPREPPDDQEEADDRKEGVNALPRSLAEPGDRSCAAAFRKDAGRMQPEKDHEAEHEDRHVTCRLSL